MYSKRRFVHLMLIAIHFEHTFSNNSKNSKEYSNFELIGPTLNVNLIKI